MCGRFTLHTSGADLAAIFGLSKVLDVPARYNIAPTQGILTLHAADDGALEPVTMRWGLIPSWAKDAKIASSTINAKAETVATKPAFRSAFKRRRCLIPADGFYEWQKLDPAGKQKQPFHVTMKDGSPFAFAGLWEFWQSPDGPVESCTVITTEPNELMESIHNRMPVILPREKYSAWLDLGNADAQSLLVPFPADQMAATKVGKAVGNVKNQGPELMTPI